MTRNRLTPAVAALGVVTLCAVFLLAAACVPATVPSEAPSIVGRVETLDGAVRGQSIVTLMVRGTPREGATFDAASVRVTRDSKVFRGTRGHPSAAAPGDITVGDEVMVWFTGPVAESYPVQATAGTVLILE